MRVYIRLAAHLRGRVGGLCGNFDGDTENDFTTRQGIVESTPELFGNSWKLSPSCPDVADQDLRDPCAVSSGEIQGKLFVDINKPRSKISYNCLCLCDDVISAERPQSHMGQEKVRGPDSETFRTLPH